MVAKLDSVSLSNDTVKRRIKEMSIDIANQVTAGIRASKFGFAIAVDESTDITSCCQLLVYARYTQNNNMKTELLISKELPGTTKGKDVFNLLDEFFTENNLDWGKLVGCTTDGAPSMLGRKSGFQAYVKDKSPKVTLVHCFIHRFALCAKVMPPELLAYLNRIIKLVNFVKASALNTRLFARLCEDLGSDHKCLLYHTEVRWLSRGNMTRRVFELRNELLVFCRQKNSNFKNDFENEEFISRLAYMSDIFETLNNITLFFEGPNSSISDFISKLEAFIRKLDIWMKNMENKQYGMFRLLTSLQRQPNDKLCQEIRCHLELLRTELIHYFPDIARYAYITNPFPINPSLLPVGTGEQEDIIEIQCDETAKTIHKESSPINFWLSMASTYKILARNAVPQLLVFPSTWECEQGFSSMMSIKAKSRNRLDTPGHDLRCAVSSVAPRIEQLVEKKQLQPSH